MRVGRTVALAWPEGLAVGHMQAVLGHRPWRSQTAHLKPSYCQVLRPRHPLQKGAKILHFYPPVFDEEHSYVPQDKGDVLPLPQAVGQEGSGALDAGLRLQPGHRGCRGHLGVCEGLHLLVAWKTTGEGWRHSASGILLQAFPKGCVLQSWHHPEKPQFWACSAEGELLSGSILDPGKGCNDCAASRGLIRRLTGQVGLVIRQVVANCKVCGQVKRGALDSHGPVSNLDPLEDSVEGAEGGNPDPLQVDEKGRAEG